MKLPEEIRRCVDACGGDISFEMLASTTMPPLDEFSTLCIAARDELAKSMGVDPEEVRMIGVKVYYEVGAPDRTGDGEYHAVAVRKQYADGVAHILEEMN